MLSPDPTAMPHPGGQRRRESDGASAGVRARLAPFVSRLGTSLAVAISCLASPAVGQSASAPAASIVPEPRQLNLEARPWTGDFDAMLERRMIRVLVPYSRTLFFLDKGHERGITAETVRDLERYLNQKYRKQLGKRPLTVYLIPTTRDKLLSGLRDGHGDIAAGNLTVTPKRLELVDFVAPEDLRTVRELIVTGPKSPELRTLDDLSGKTIHVRSSTSYHESVVALNERFAAAGKAPVRIASLSNALEDEDKLEMLNAGLLEIVLVDDWKVRMWAQVLPRIRVREDLVLRDGGRTGWAIRKGSPKLAEALDDAWRNFAPKQGVIEYRFATFHKNIEQITNNTGKAEWKRFEETIALFEKYGTQYGFDPLMLAAQGYQESRLRQDAKSRSGAIGVMQLMPATGKELQVGDIRKLEPNVHGGARYMDRLMTRYFQDAEFSPTNHALFAFASYNAGPGNIRKMRKLAAQRGLDPDKWFNNVEVVTAEKIGLETTTYVRNIYKYYTAYKLTLRAQEERRKAREALAPADS
jgi:membrane-bound lytic murein transglycosylase MltF